MKLWQAILVTGSVLCLSACSEGPLSPDGLAPAFAKGGKPGPPGGDPDLSVTATDLGSLSGNSWATDINDAGEIVGRSDSSSGRRAVFWAPDNRESPVDLNTLVTEENLRWATAINDLGAVVGLQGGGSFLLTFGPNDAEVTHLDDETARAQDINDDGTVVGYRVQSTGPVGFIWVDGTFYDLKGGTLAFGINSDGHVVGRARDDASGEVHAAIWLDPINSPLADPILLGGGPVYDWSYAYGVSDRVDDIVYVAGQQGNDSGDYRATLWTVHLSSNSVIVDVDDLGPSSYAFDVNSKGEVVGQIGQKPRAHVWRVSDGLVPVELGALTGRGTSSASAINNAGLIVGWSKVSTKGKDKGLEHAVLWELSS